MVAKKNAISPTRAENFSQWYLNVIKEAQLAKHGEVVGTQVIMPYGYAVWEEIQSRLDKEIKVKGHKNFYAPLLMELDALEQEASHMDFAKECAVVTHSRLGMNDSGELVPQRPLTKPVVIRPTSEAIIGPIVKGMIESHRDLPVLLNQWANVVRWEMRTRLFLRSSEFLWQEGHTFHATADESHAHSKTMLGVYESIFRDVLALNPIVGEKPAYERFAGANHTYTLELMMQDGKALQGGTSHDLGQNFSKAYDISYTDENGDVVATHGTSWGVTTRLIGALVMTHADDDGLRLPPCVAPEQIVILPINTHVSDEVLPACQALADGLSQLQFMNKPVRAHVDVRDMRGGEKSWDWVKRGAPIRIEIGPRDLTSGKMMLMMRHEGVKEKHSVALDDLQAVVDRLSDVHDGLVAQAQQWQAAQTSSFDTKEAMMSHFAASQGFAWVAYEDGQGSEAELKELGLTVRCLVPSDGVCVFTGKPTTTRALIAKAY